MGIDMIFPKRRFGSMMLLSILAPISLLAAFRIVGVIPEPQTPHEVFVEAVSWTKERPSGHVYLTDGIQNAYTDAHIRMTIEIQLFSYEENAGFSPFEGRDGIAFRANASLVVTQGRTTSMVLKFSPKDSNSIIFLRTDDYWKLFPPHNLRVTDMRQVGTNASEAFVQAQPTGSFSTVTLGSSWVFLEDSVEGHHVRVDLEAVHFDGTTYRRIEVPLDLGVL
jgi:hypothetical protein